MCLRGACEGAGALAAFEIYDKMGACGLQDAQCCPCMRGALAAYIISASHALGWRRSPTVLFSGLKL